MSYFSFSINSRSRNEKVGATKSLAVRSYTVYEISFAR